MHDDAELVDQILHIVELKEQIQESCDGQALIERVDEDMPPALEEKFLEYVLAWEQAEQVTHREMLARDGVAPPPLEELTEEELTRALAELIQALARRRHFLTSTDHLSDRELYSLLCHDLLDNVGPVLDPDGDTNCHIDPVSSGSEEDIHLWLTYYADEEERARWASEWPDDPIPPHQDPPYDRDRFLPQAYHLE
jgi:hypothetical protein